MTDAWKNYIKIVDENRGTNYLEDSLVHTLTNLCKDNNAHVIFYLFQDYVEKSNTNIKLNSLVHHVLVHSIDNRAYDVLLMLHLHFKINPFSIFMLPHEYEVAFYNPIIRKILGNNIKSFEQLRLETGKKDN